MKEMSHPPFAEWANRVADLRGAKPWTAGRDWGGWRVRNLSVQEAEFSRHISSSRTAWATWSWKESGAPRGKKDVCDLEKSNLYVLLKLNVWIWGKMEIIMMFKKSRRQPNWREVESTDTAKGEWAGEVGELARSFFLRRESVEESQTSQGG